jgi:hypothetical protein
LQLAGHDIARLPLLASMKISQKPRISKLKIPQYATASQAEIRKEFMSDPGLHGADALRSTGSDAVSLKMAVGVRTHSGSDAVIQRAARKRGFSACAEALA